MLRALALVSMVLPRAGSLRTPAASVASLATRARQLRKTWEAPTPSTTAEALRFDSSFEYGASSRDFANWLLPGRLMIGQYPGLQPTEPGPSAAECEAHVRRVVGDARVRTFVQLQAELSPQDDAAAWPATGAVQLPDAADRARFPGSFARYAGFADGLGAAVSYIHAPIVDLDVPSDERLAGALGDVLARFEEAPNDAIYVHCWAGCGRAGTVGACVSSLLFPELDADEVLDLVQTGYASRAGADAWPNKRSPETEAQRDFVRAFVAKVRKAAAAVPPAPPSPPPAAKERKWPAWQDDLPSGGL